MQGLNKEIDWVKLTLENRILDISNQNGDAITYKSVAEQWQIDIDRAITEFPRVYLQLPRGHDKTDRYAWWTLLWLESTQAKRAYAVGVDRDNARLFRDSSKKLKALHPELFSEIEVEKHVVFSKRTGSYIETISSDANSAYGLNFDLLVINDFHAWPDKSFWEVLWTACEKKPDIRVWIESNALTLGSQGAIWVAQQRKWVKEKGSVRQIERYGKPEWWFFCPNEFLAKWVLKDKLQDWRDTLHPSAFKRLIENRDTSDADSYLTIEQVEAVEKYETPFNGRSSEKGQVVTAIDLGLTKDATAITTVQAIPQPKNSPPRLVLLRQEVVTGSADDPVLIAEVERIAFSHAKRYNSWPILADPWQMKSTLQRFPGTFKEWAFTTKHIAELTSILYRVIADQNLALYKNCAEMEQKEESWNLKRELISAVVKDMSYGQRVDHRAGGFSDRLMSLGMCCHHLLDGSIPLQTTPKIEVIEKDEWQSEKMIKGWITEATTGRKSDTGAMMGLLNL